jgi:hypothetical protein
MSSKTTSQLFETIETRLLEEDNLFSVTIVDPSGNEHLVGSTEIVNPFEFDSKRFIPNAQPMDLDRFIEVANDVIQYAQEREAVPENLRVELIGEYPRDDFSAYRGGAEVITWRLVSREPAKMNAKGTGRPQRAAGFSYDLQNSSYPNKVITVQTRPLDHIIEFVVWSKDAGKANRRAMWLERLFIAHSWAFKIQGADRFFFEKRLADNYRTTGGQPIYERALRFQVRLMEFQVIADPMIRHITFELGLKTFSDDDN